MQDLEERGLLKQPHTSAGRIPTDLGYRYYVDRLLRPEPLTRNESAEIRKEVDHDPGALNEILAQTSKLLARLTNQLGVTVSPAFEKGVLSKIDLVQVANNRVLVILARQEDPLALAERVDLPRRDPEHRSLDQRRVSDGQAAAAVGHGVQQGRDDPCHRERGPVGTLAREPRDHAVRRELLAEGAQEPGDGLRRPLGG